MDPKGLVIIGAALVGGMILLSTLKGAEVQLPATGGMMALGSRPTDLDRQTRDAGEATDDLVARSAGPIASGPVAAHDRSPAVFIADAIRDWRPAEKSEVVARVQLIQNRRDCAPTPPDEDARVVALFVSHSDTRAGLYSYTQGEVIQGIRDWFKAIHYDNWSEGDPIRMRSDPGFRLHDIAVTDVSAPVYIVVRHLDDGNLVYNFHLAPGVEIARVVMLGGRANAVANLPDDVPVEVMDQATLAACGVGMAGPEQTQRAASAQSSAGGIHPGAAKEANAGRPAGTQDFESWLNGQFGLSWAAGAVGLRYGEVSLIGPVWRTDSGIGVPYRPLSGAHLTAQVEAHFAVAGLNDWPDDFYHEVRRLGRELAGGDPVAVLRGSYFFWGK